MPKPCMSRQEFLRGALWAGAGLPLVFNEACGGSSAGGTRVSPPATDSGAPAAPSGSTSTDGPGGRVPDASPSVASDGATGAAPDGPSASTSTDGASPAKLDGSTPRGSDAAADGTAPGGPATVCTTTPPVPEGPFYKDEKLNRSDITDGRDGVRITYEFLVQDARCQPIAGAIVDIWQADRAGVYSDFPSQGSAGLTFLRGYQATDGMGRCRFTSIFPGWYSGRLTHLHGKLRIGAVTKTTTNFFFPKAVETEVYDSPLYRGRGQNNVTVARDIELRGDMARFNALTMQVTGTIDSGYVARFTFTG